jgi:4-aminobutyrate aminotransferase-like enzyme
MGAQMMSGNTQQKKWIGPLDKNIYHIPFPYPWSLKKMSPENFLLRSLSDLKKKHKLNLNEDICGVMIETFQGWGAIFYPKEYIKKLSQICKKNKILITFDEMQSGFARTGYAFGYEYYDVKPDLICCGKGMGGGIALSGVIGKKKVMDLPEVGNMSSTHSANPLQCAAGLAVLEEIKDKKLIQNTKIKGALLKKLLINIKKNFEPYIDGVYGQGLLAALVFKKLKNKDISKILKDVCLECMRNGLLVVYTGRESIKLGPPLTITSEAIEEAMYVFEKSIEKILKKNDLY